MLVRHFVSFGPFPWPRYNDSLCRFTTQKPLTCLLVLYCSCRCNCSALSQNCLVPAELNFGTGSLLNWNWTVSESESYITTDGQSTSLSWYKAPVWDLRPDMFCGAPSLTRGWVCLLYSCWPSPAYSFLGPSLFGLATIFYCLRFETELSLFYCPLKTVLCGLIQNTVYLDTTAASVFVTGEALLRFLFSWKRYIIYALPRERI
jgi:hypothetical protein